MDNKRINELENITSVESGDLLPILDVSDDSFTGVTKNIRIDQLPGGTGGAVDSVNGKVGSVTLNASDVGLGDTATISHHKTSTGIIYDLIEIKNANAKSITKRFAPGYDNTGAVDKIPAREFSKQTGYRYVMNADGFLNADGTPGWNNVNVRPCGLQIVDNTVVVEWDNVAHADFPQAVIMQSNGILAPAFLDDGKSGQEWVDEGALWSVGWGAFCVLNGEQVPISQPNHTMQEGVKTARPVLCQKANGDIFIIQIEGKTDVYGATTSEVSALCYGLGAKTAFIMDGGGSSQNWWNGTYAVPSSDTSGNFPSERGVPTFLTIDCERVQEEYDSGTIVIETNSNVTPMSGAGPVLYLRHIGKNVFVSVRAAGTFPASVSTQIVDAGKFPFRYMNTSDGLSRLNITGNSGRHMSLIISPGTQNGTINNYTSGTNMTYATGSGSWQAQFTDIDYI